jgi:hypothetical protein
VASWIYNKKKFLEDILLEMQAEKAELIKEIRDQDRKLQIITKPFGGYRNVLEIEDIYFEDQYLPDNLK